MGRICRVPGCDSNYGESKAKNQKLKEQNDTKNAGRNKIDTFGFPSKEKSPDERIKWIKAIPMLTEELVDSWKKPAVCVKHWPLNFEQTTSINGKVRPKYPPSRFEGFKPSQIPAPPPMARPTHRTTFEVRTRLEDELSKFIDADSLTFEELTAKASSHEFCAPVVSFMSDNLLWIQSTEFISGTPSFLLKIYKDLTFEAFHMGIRCYISTLSKNRITRVNKWSRIEEAVRFLRNSEMTQKKTILIQQVGCMNAHRVGEKKYPPEVTVRAFEYYTISRSSYERIRIDYELPSVTVLQNLTSKVNNISDKKFIEDIFSNLKERQKQCVFMVDEIYVKKTLTYHGGQVFGKARNDGSKLANAVLGIMVKCLFGGPTFLLKMVPVKGMKTQFLFEQVSEMLSLIKMAGGKPACLICDGNRTNQKLFKMFSTVESKPWLTTDGMYLLFDFVHLIKSIRNNWLTERMGELNFEQDSQTFTARWADIMKLFKLESEDRLNGSGVRGLSKLNEVSVQPKPIERQKVETCLRVFSDETLHALQVYPGMDKQMIEGTTLFIKNVLSMWKILNVNNKDKNIKSKDENEAPISSADDPRLQFLIDIADMFRKMEKKGKGKREKCLTRDTSNGLYHTLNGLVELCKHQLKTTHNFVLLGNYSNDPLEKAFGKLRQGSGGTYFLSVQQVMEKLSINKTKLLLRLNENVHNLDVVNGHQCDNCGYLLDEKSAEVFDNMPELEEKISKETKMSLVHMAGYVTRHDDLSERELLDVTTFYYQKYGDYTKSLDRGGLKVPSDTACQWTFFCHILFSCVKDQVCRTSLANLFMMISDMHTFNMNRKHANILSNIFFKNYCIESTPRSSKEPNQKVLKLSEKN